MISKDKMFIVSSSLDDSIKSQTSVYDITLFKTFTSFEKYIDSIPVVVDTIIFTSDELQFNASNMQRMAAILASPFLKLTGNVIYLIDKSYNLDTINNFLLSSNWRNWAVYQGDLSAKFITEIVTGEGRNSVEAQNETLIIRMRATEFLKQKNSMQNRNDDDKYLNEEDLLEDIPIEEESEEEKSRVEANTIVSYIVGDTIERTVMVFLLAQYYSLSGKTLIAEKDWEYHSLTEMVTKSEIPCQIIYIEELMKDAATCVEAIRKSKENLIVIGCKNRKKFSYNFIMDILESNLKGELARIIRECDYAETPYGRYYTVVTPNTVPEVLRCCNNLRYSPKNKKVNFIGMQLNDLGPVNISSAEMSAVLSTVLETNDLAAQTIKVHGIHLKGEKTAYDILGIIDRGNG